MANSHVTMTSKTDYRAFVKVMKMLDKQAIPAIATETLNLTADSVTKQQIRNAKQKFIIRTPYTLKSMESSSARPYKALNKARGKDISKMFSRSGSFSPYLWMQDTDGDFIENGLYGGPVPIPTLKIRTSQSLQKAIRAKYRISDSEKFRPGNFGTIDGYARHFVGKPRGGNRRYGVYERGYRNKRLFMLRNLEHQQVRIKDTNFHEDAVKKYATNSLIFARFKRASMRELKKRGVA